MANLGRILLKQLHGFTAKGLESIQGLDCRGERLEFGTASKKSETTFGAGS